MNAEVDMFTLLSDDKSALGVFVYHEDPDVRVEVEAALFRAGAEFIAYPDTKNPARISGLVTVSDVTVNVLAGPLHIVGALELPARELETATHAILLILHEPFDIDDKSEKALLAADLPLEILERNET